MKEYKQPETRIKVVTQGSEVKYYPQYKQVIIPYIWWEWDSTINQFLEEPWTFDLQHAKKSIDDFLERDEIWQEDQVRKERKKEKIKVEYIKYP